MAVPTEVDDAAVPSFVLDMLAEASQLHEQEPTYGLWGFLGL